MPGEVVDEVTSADKKGPITVADLDWTEPGAEGAEAARAKVGDLGPQEGPAETSEPHTLSEPNQGKVAEAQAAVQNAPQEAPLDPAIYSADRVSSDTSRYAGGPARVGNDGSTGDGYKDNYPQRGNGRIMTPEDRAREERTAKAAEAAWDRVETQNKHAKRLQSRNPLARGLERIRWAFTSNDKKQPTPYGPGGKYGPRL